MSSALVAASSTAIQGSQGDTAQSSTATLERADFERAVNTSFELRSASGDRTFLVLASVDDFKYAEPASQASLAVRPPRHGAVPRTETFALNFFGTGVNLLQDTYTVSHASLGTFSLFIVPSGNSYVAVFNRLTAPRSRV